MQVTGSASVRTDPALVFAALTDPRVLAVAVPGCERFEAVGEEHYRFSARGSLASVDGVYDGELRVAERQPQQALLVHGRLSGAAGTVDAMLRLQLADDAQSGTVLGYEADVTADGMLAGVGQRLLHSAVRRVLAEFVAGVDRAVADGREPAVVTPHVTDPVYQAPERDRTRPDTGALLIAAAVGAAIALVSVGIGRRLRRLAMR